MKLASVAAVRPAVRLEELIEPEVLATQILEPQLAELQYFPRRQL